MYETELPENENKRKSSGIRRNQNNFKTNKSCYPDLNWRPHPYQLARGFGKEYLLALLDPFGSRMVGKRVVLKTKLCRPVPGDTGVCLKIV